MPSLSRDWLVQKTGSRAQLTAPWSRASEQMVDCSKHCSGQPATTKKRERRYGITKQEQCNCIFASVPHQREVSGALCQGQFLAAHHAPRNTGMR